MDNSIDRNAPAFESRVRAAEALPLLSSTGTIAVRGRAWYGDNGIATILVSYEDGLATRI